MVACLALISCKYGVCLGCVLDKYHKGSFQKHASWHASLPLQLVHNDFCVFVPSSSFYGFKYFLSFINEFTRCTWVCFLKLESDFFDKFLAYKALLEKQYVQQIYKLGHIMEVNK